MKPIDFKERNMIYTKPKGMTDEECGPLPVYRDGIHNISCWKLDLKERVGIVLKGLVWVDVLGASQPPIAIGAEPPFVEVRECE